ncbi:MAG: MBL fold metallo-hydrolase [Melioribacteraceae bacterium]|nr:MBL fold metallo-hydrolase [Melioribacteraceae bacterium]MDD3559636.1 MBL fold metallo-hydrolase [Melioribacteraceae bacterium]
MKIKFIGTSSGKTSLRRFHSSILISSSGKNILIDAGDSVARALLNCSVNILSIDSIFITHLHSDHIAGLPSLITQMKLSGREEELRIFTVPNSTNHIKNILNTCYLFEEGLNFSIIYSEFKLSDWNHLNDEIEFYPIQNSHISNKLNVSYDQQFISVSLVFSVETKVILYSSDIGGKNDLNLFTGFNSDIMILECTHVTTDEISSYIKLSGCKNIILTHIPDETEEKLEKFVNKFDVKDVKLSLAKDGLSLNI